MGWIVAVAEHRCPEALAASLLDHGLNFYRPRFRQRVVAHGRRKWLEGYLLGCYVLIELAMKISEIGEKIYDWADQYHLVSGIRGVAGVLTSSERRPFLVLDREIDRLRKTERRGYVVVPDRPEFKAGQRVRIVGGPLVDRPAIFKFSTDMFDFVDVPGLMSVNAVQLPCGMLVAA